MPPVQMARDDLVPQRKISVIWEKWASDSKDNCRTRITHALRCIHISVLTTGCFVCISVNTNQYKVFHYNGEAIVYVLVFSLQKDVQKKTAAVLYDLYSKKRKSRGT